METLLSFIFTAAEETYFKTLEIREPSVEDAKINRIAMTTMQYISRRQRPIGG